LITPNAITVLAVAFVLPETCFAQTRGADCRDRCERRLEYRVEYLMVFCASNSAAAARLRGSQSRDAAGW